MAESCDQAATLRMTDLDDAQLLGFEMLESQLDEAGGTEQAVGLAFNKRGLAEGGEPPP